MAPTPDDSGMADRRPGTMIYDPGSAVEEGAFPSGLTQSEGITSQDGALYVVDSSSGDELWRIDDPTSPGSAVEEGSFPIRSRGPTGITSQGGALYVVDALAMNYGG